MSYSPIQLVLGGFWFEAVMNSAAKNIFFFLIFFLMWTIFKVLHLLQYCFCSLFGFFEACRISAHQLKIKPAPPALEGEVLTTGPSEKSLLRMSSFPSLGGHAHTRAWEGNCWVLELRSVEWGEVPPPPTPPGWLPTSPVGSDLEGRQAGPLQAAKWNSVPRC